MFSGKTSSLIEAYTRHSIGKRRCLLIKYKDDVRYDVHNVVSHNGRAVQSTVSCGMLCEVDYLVDEYQVICIDEIQFFDDAPIFCDKWANQGLIVEASGLSGTYQRKEFPVISQLLPLAEEVHKKSAVCEETGDDANFTCRTSDEVGDIVIGGSDKYKPVDRMTYFGNNETQLFKKHDLESFTEFIKTYCHKHEVNLDEIHYKKLIQFFGDSKTPNKCYLNIFEQFLKKYNIDAGKK